MKKTLPYDKAKIEAIIKEYPTPFHIYDEHGLRTRVRALQKAFSWNKGYKEYYAVKACPNPVLMQILKEEGCGMDCSSYAELMLSEAVGIVADNIMFSSNATPAKDFEYARRLDAIINLDDISHIDFLAKHGGIPKTICCRFNPGGEFKIGTQIMGNPADAKYGFTRAQLTEGMKKLKELGVTEFGLHSFLSSNNTDNMYYPTLAKLLFETAKELHNELGIKIGFINLSGGVGIPYRPEDAETDIQFVGDKVHEAYEAAFAGTRSAAAHFHGARPLCVRPRRNACDDRAAREENLQGLHRLRCVRRKPDAPRDVWRVPSRDRTRQGGCPLRPSV